jgi:alkylhydroperoxidase/carboxymuconolactone decarboxylase family protein YurZ
LRLNNLSELELLALLSASSVLRKSKYFEIILERLMKNKCPTIKIYEALLQTYLFAGFPSALISLKRLNEVVSKKKIYTGYELKTYLQRGEKNCRRIYGDKYDKLISNVKSFSSELAEWLIVEGYGKVLGRKGLTIKEREVCIVSILSALKFKDQIYSHINGAIRIKVRIELIYKIIFNLELISAKSSTKYGLSVFKKFQLDKK